jgi:hypothetical protein
MPMRRPFRASRVDDPPELLPPELEARVAALEAGASGTDFDAVSWVWMVLFGIVLPVSLIVLGW